MEREYRNVGYFLLILFILMLFGFYKPYFALFPNFDKTLNTVVHIHATALILWVVLLVVQPLLIRFHKYTAHKLIGKFTYFLVPIIVISSIAVMNKQYHEYIEQNMTAIKSLKALYIPFFEITLYSLFYILAIINIRKNNVALHMRYIICAALVFIIPSLARVTGYWYDMGQLYSYINCFILIDVILMLLIFFDRRKKLNNKPYVIALILFIFFDLGWGLLGCPF